MSDYIRPNINAHVRIVLTKKHSKRFASINITTVYTGYIETKWGKQPLHHELTICKTDIEDYDRLIIVQNPSMNDYMNGDARDLPYADDEIPDTPYSICELLAEGLTHKQAEEKKKEIDRKYLIEQLEYILQKTKEDIYFVSTEHFIYCYLAYDYRNIEIMPPSDSKIRNISFRSDAECVNPTGILQTIETDFNKIKSLWCHKTYDKNGSIPKPETLETLIKRAYEQFDDDTVDKIIRSLIAIITPKGNYEIFQKACRTVYPSDSKLYTENPLAWPQTIEEIVRKDIIKNDFEQEARNPLVEFDNNAHNHQYDGLSDEDFQKLQEEVIEKAKMWHRKEKPTIKKLINLIITGNEVSDALIQIRWVYFNLLSNNVPKLPNVCTPNSTYVADIELMAKAMYGFGKNHPKIRNGFHPEWEYPQLIYELMQNNMMEQLLLNPSIHFTRNAKDSQFDDMSDEEFQNCLDVIKYVSMIWKNNQELPLKDLLKNITLIYTGWEAQQLIRALLSILPRNYEKEAILSDEDLISYMIRK